MIKEYLKILEIETLEEDLVKRYSANFTGAKSIIDLARDGSSSAYDAILEFVRKSNYGLYKEKNKSFGLSPYIALLMTCDKGSQKESKEIFLRCLYRILSDDDGEGPFRSDIISINKENTFFDDLKEELCEEMPRLFFEYKDNLTTDKILFEDSINGFDIRQNILTIIAFYGLSYLNYPEKNNRLPYHILKKEGLFDFLMVLKQFPDLEILNTRLSKEEMKCYDFPKSNYSFEEKNRFYDDDEYKKYLININNEKKTTWYFLLKFLEITTECKTSVGRENTLSYMHLWFDPKNGIPTLTEIGRQILGACIELSEVGNFIIEKLKIHPDSEKIWLTGMDDIFADVIFTIKAMQSRSKILLDRYPELQKYKENFKGLEPKWPYRLLD